MKLGLVMEAAQAQQGMAASALERLREHTAGLDAVVREEIRATLIEELQALEAESRRTAAALQALQRAAGRRALLGGAAALSSARSRSAAPGGCCPRGASSRHSARRAPSWRPTSRSSASMAAESSCAVAVLSSACAYASTALRHATASRPITWSCRATEHASGVAGNDRPGDRSSACWCSRLGTAARRAYRAAPAAHRQPPPRRARARRGAPRGATCAAAACGMGVRCGSPACQSHRPRRRGISS